MRVALAVTLFALGCAPLVAQTQAPAAYTYHDPSGFSYAVPADWEIVDAQASMSDAKGSATENASSDAEKKGIACAQIGLTARHGDPAAVIVVEILPYDCFGQQMTENDLHGFGTGAAEGLKQSFDVGDPRITTYDLDSHHLWIERVPGTPKSQPDMHYTVEIACTLLHKAAVCWMTLATDPASLAIFEQSAVTLEGDSPTPLVPAGTFPGPAPQP
jgi:hypothetical protein